MKRYLAIILFSIATAFSIKGHALPLFQTVPDTLKGLVLPEQTSQYNRGGDKFAGRYKDKDGEIRKFELIGGKAPLYDGGGRLLQTVTKPIKINMGTEKEMKIGGKTENYIWAWDTNIGLSGWMARTALVDPPALLSPTGPFSVTNPAPPQEEKKGLKINTAQAVVKLASLVHKNSKGELPTGGNQGIHYAGRNPGALDYVYLLRAVPNVQKGGTAKDSLPDGSMFILALDESGKPITEVMTMYQHADLTKPVLVTFVYGRQMNSKMYGWIARANIGDL